jgi:peptidoglycan-N-acetylglucosamine deacetylase
MDVGRGHNRQHGVACGPGSPVARRLRLRLRPAPRRAVAGLTAGALFLGLLTGPSVLGPAPAEAAAPCSRGVVALTFDDGPNPSSTPRVLDVLRNRGVKGTFFVVGQRVNSYPSVTVRTYNEGHVIANHTWAHERLTSLSDAGIRDTIGRTNRRLAALGVPTPTLVRPPYGATNTRVRNAIHGMGMTQVMWNIDPQDWRSGRSASTIANNVLSNLRDGGNVVMHDSSGNSSNMIAALPTIIDGARSRGYCFGTLSRTGAVTLPVPTARIGDVTVREGSTTVHAPLDIRLSEPTVRDVSVAYATRDGTAKAGLDYERRSGTATFPAGTTSRRITIPVYGNDLDQPDRTFEVVLASPSGLRIGQGTAKVTVLDDDPPPAVEVLDAQVVEGAAGTRTTVHVPVRLSGPSGRPTAVRYTTQDGTARAGTDYRATSGRVILETGQTRTTIPVRVHGDDVVQGDRTFRVVLHDPIDLTVRRSTATVRIVDDDVAAWGYGADAPDGTQADDPDAATLPSMDLLDAEVTAPPVGERATVHVAVRLSAPSDRPLAVRFTTEDGTAIAGSDYLATSGRLILEAGQTEATVPVRLLGGGLEGTAGTEEAGRSDGTAGTDEVARTLQLVLHDPIGVTIGRGTATLRIVPRETVPAS